MNITIVNATDSHAAVIATIGKKTYRHEFGHLFHKREDLSAYLAQTYDPVKLARSLRKKQNVYFLALLDNVPAGFAKVKVDSLNEHIESIAQMEMQKLYVLHEYQGRGVGTALVNRVKEFAQELNPDFLWLDTCVDSRAVCFHEKNGFEKIGKYYFTIGTQVFEYHVMGWPVAVGLKTAC